MKYMKAMMDIVELEVEDVVLTSGGGTDCPAEGQPCDGDNVIPCQFEL